jgi:hypothetical protein
MIYKESSRDIRTGLTKKATLLGVIDEAKQTEYKNDKAEAEFTMAQALASSSVQLVELKLLNIKFSGYLRNCDWLRASAEHLVPCLQILVIDECGVEGSIPSEIGLLRHLNVLKLVMNKLTGTPSLPPPDLPSTLRRRLAFLISYRTSWMV